MLLRCRAFYAPMLAPPSGSQTHPPLRSPTRPQPGTPPTWPPPRSPTRPQPGTPTHPPLGHQRIRRRGYQRICCRRHRCGRRRRVVRVAAREAGHRGQPLLTARKPVSHHHKQRRNHVVERLSNLLFDNAWNLRHFFLELCLRLLPRAFLLSRRAIVVRPFCGAAFAGHTTS